MATSAIAAGAGSLAGRRVPRARAGTKPAGGRAAFSVRAHGPGGGQHLTPEVSLDPRSPRHPSRRPRAPLLRLASPRVLFTRAILLLLRAARRGSLAANTGRRGGQYAVPRRQAVIAAETQNWQAMV